MKKNLLNNMTLEQKISYGKALAAVVVIFIVMVYALSFALKSRNYNSYVNYDSILDSHYIADGVYLGEVSVGGLNKEQAIAVGESDYSGARLDNYRITIATDYGYSKDYTYRELGAEYNIKNAVDDAYDVAKTGSINSRLALLDEISGRGEHIIPDYKVNESDLKDAVNNIAADVNKEYNLKGKTVDTEALYDTLYEYMIIEQYDMIVYVPSVDDNAEE